jgi:hypothetical protein
MEITIMTTLKARLMPLALCLAAFWSSGSQAVLIDNFEAIQLTDATACSAVCQESSQVLWETGMIGDRTITIDKLAGFSGQGSTATVGPIGPLGVLNMENGGGVMADMTVLWDNFGGTGSIVDLTEAGMNEGFYFSIPNFIPIDNDLTLTIVVNGTSTVTKIYPNNSFGLNFFVDFDDLTDPSLVNAATSLSFTFSNGAAWDAAFNFIGTQPDNPEVPAPATLALFGLALAGLGWSRRQKRHS